MKIVTTILPALCAIFLRSESGKKKFFLFRIFNWFFGGFQSAYGWSVGKAVRIPVFVLLLWGALVAVLSWGMKVMPHGFLPNEDQGVLFIDARLPDGSSVQRTGKVAEKIQKIVEPLAGKKTNLLITGYSMIDGFSSTNTMLGVIQLDPWEERGPELHADVLQAKLMREFAAAIPEAQVLVFQPPYDVLNLLYGNRIHACERLVQHHKFRLNSQTPCNLRTPSFAAAESVA